MRPWLVRLLQFVGNCRLHLSSFVAVGGAECRPWLYSRRPVLQLAGVDGADANNRFRSSRLVNDAARLYQLASIAGRTFPRCAGLVATVNPTTLRRAKDQAQVFVAPDIRSL